MVLYFCTTIAELRTEEDLSILLVGPDPWLCIEILEFFTGPKLYLEIPFSSNPLQVKGGCISKVLEGKKSAFGKQNL